MTKTPQLIIDLIRAEVPAKISRNEFCRRTGINPNSYDGYISGIRYPTPDTFQKLADYFNETFVIEYKPQSGGSV